MARNLMPGDKVTMVKCAEAEIYPVVRSLPWMLCGTEVVLLVGKAGGFATKCLRKVG